MQGRAEGADSMFAGLVPAFTWMVKGSMWEPALGRLNAGQPAKSGPESEGDMDRKPPAGHPTSSSFAGMRVTVFALEKLSHTLHRVSLP